MKDPIPSFCQSERSNMQFYCKKHKIKQKQKYLSLLWRYCSQSCCTQSWRQWRKLCSWCCTSSRRSYRSDQWSYSCKWRHCCPSPWPYRKLHHWTDPRSLWWSLLHIPSLLPHSGECTELKERRRIKMRIISSFNPFTVVGDKRLPV